MSSVWNVPFYHVCSLLFVMPYVHLPLCGMDVRLHHMIAADIARMGFLQTLTRVLNPHINTPTEPIEFQILNIMRSGTWPAPFGRRIANFAAAVHGGAVAGRGNAVGSEDAEDARRSREAPDTSLDRRKCQGWYPYCMFLYVFC